MFINEYFGHEMSISESYMFMSKVIWSWDVYEWKWFGHEMSMSEWFGHEMSTSEWFGHEMSMSEWYGHEIFTNESDLIMRC
jgi:hypothetical protein